jgi:hypothetical protein
MAIKKSVAGYAIQVSGEYFSRDANGNKGIKQFGPFKFELPEIVSYVEGRKKIEKIVNGRATTTTVANIKKGNASRVGLHIIRRYYIPFFLKDKFPEYTGVRKCSIFSKEKIQMEAPKKLTAANIQNMKESELRQFVMLNDINMLLDQYGDLGDMKNAVIVAYKQKKQDDIAAGKTDAMSRDEEALLPADGIAEDDGAMETSILG